MSKAKLAYMLFSLVILTGGLTWLGAFMDHNGLFEAGSTGLKVTLGAAAGAFGSALSKG